jgi:hypothetical protein
MLRFTIRDLLWLMVVVGMGCGWLLERRNSYTQREDIAGEREALVKKRQQIDMLDSMVSRQIGYLEHEARRLGIQPPGPTPGPQSYEDASK